MAVSVIARPIEARARTGNRATCSSSQIQRSEASDTRTGSDAVEGFIA